MAQGDVSDRWTDNDQRQVDEAAKRFPQYLYRYVSLVGEIKQSQVRDQIERGEIYFARLTSFNDPFDSYFVVDSTGEPDRVRTFWESSEAAKGLEAAEREARIDHCVREAGSERESERMRAAAMQMRQEYGMLCMSSRNDDILMWSYYAAGHSGLCIRYQMHKEAWFGLGEMILPLEVEYAEAPPTFRFYYDGRFAAAKALLGTKAKIWSHEGEWRMVLPSFSGSKILPLAHVDQVILGINTPDEDIERVKRWVSRRSVSMEILQAQHRKGEYGLDLVGPD